MRGRAEDLVRQRFGAWLVVWNDGPGPTGHVRYVCRCDCGEVRIVRGDLLKAGTSQSCGCLARLEARQRYQERIAALRVYRDDSTD